MDAAPGGMTIDLWTWPLSPGDGEIERLGALLSEDERARAARFVFDRHRERFIVARGRLRQILGGLVARPPEDLRFAYGDHGKPTLGGIHGAPHFNLSHSEDIAALAVSDLELGVDIEAVRPLKEDVAGRFFSAAEIAALAQLRESERLDGFYRCWTRKEAVIKALGTGLSLPLKSFDVSIGAAGARLLRLEGMRDAPRDWALANLDPAPGYAGAIACNTGGIRPAIRVCAWPSASGA